MNIPCKTFTRFKSSFYFYSVSSKISNYQEKCASAVIGSLPVLFRIMFTHSTTFVVAIHNDDHHHMTASTV